MLPTFRARIGEEVLAHAEKEFLRAVCSRKPVNYLSLAASKAIGCSMSEQPDVKTRC